MNTKNNFDVTSHMHLCEQQDLVFKSVVKFRNISKRSNFTTIDLRMHYTARTMFCPMFCHPRNES